MNKAEAILKKHVWFSDEHEAFLPIARKSGWTNKQAILAAMEEYAQSPRWVKASDRLPGLFRSVEWRNHEGGDIPLGKMTILEKIEKSGAANTGWHEWLDEAP